MIRVLKSLILIICISGIAPANAKIFNVHGIDVEIQGYLGYQYIGATVPGVGDTIKSTPQGGLIVNFKFTDEWAIYNQFRYNDRLVGVPVYNFIEWTPNWSNDINVKFVAGNIIHSYGLYGNRRQNPRTRPAIVEPQGMYWNILEQTLTGGTGVGAAISYKGLTLRYDISKPHVIDPKDETSAWAGSLLRSLDVKFGSHQIVTLNWDPVDLPIRTSLGYMSFDAGKDIEPRAPKALTNLVLNNSKFEAVTAGIEYSQGPITLSAEGLGVRYLDAKLSQPSSLSKGYSLSAIYDINSNWSVRANYNEYASHLSRLVPNPQPWMVYAKDINVGVDYTKNNWLVRAELHHINGSRWVQPSQIAKDPAAFQDWWMGGVSVTYFFE